MTPKVTPPGHIKWPNLKLRFSKFDIVPKAHQWSELFKLAVYSKDIGVYNLYLSDFFISVTLGHVNFVTSPL